MDFPIGEFSELCSAKAYGNPVSGREGVDEFGQNVKPERAIRNHVYNYIYIQYRSYMMMCIYIYTCIYDDH